ncbi:MAG: folylpolyglutamate synthase/dihydrofolate synthase family protein [Pseudomonadota bacterium]|nr:folylpolyglutamate synthase/dihydrofolate synthase family protein [Pseudomonadota bacterium]
MRLQGWLARLESYRPERIELGLERVCVVFQRLALNLGDMVVVTVGGTNGKGSSVAYLESVYRAAGYRVGAYTSPHLHHVGERIRIDGRRADDEALCDAFDAVAAAAGSTALTYFEFITLAALELFAAAQIQVLLLEVGLGGRLDAVNIVDADVALITNIALDHTDWLGPDRESIAREKAGIMRPGRPVVCADPEPPLALLEHARSLGADLWCLNDRFGCRQTDDGFWSLRVGAWRLDGLPLPAMRGPFQLTNAAAALTVVQLLQPRLPAGSAALRVALTSTLLPAHVERLGGWVLDVAHNPAAAGALWTALQPHSGRHRLLFSSLADEDAAGMLATVPPEFGEWHLAPLTQQRALDGPGLERVAGIACARRDVDVRIHATVADAVTHLRDTAAPDERIVAFG